MDTAEVTVEAAAATVDTAEGKPADTGVAMLAVIVAASELAATTVTRAAIAAATLVDSVAEPPREDSTAAAASTVVAADFMVAEAVAPTAVADTGNPQLPNTT